MAEPNGINGLALVFKLESQVFFTHQALRNNFNLFAKRWCGKSLPPHFMVQGVHQIDPAVFGCERPVGGKLTLQGSSV